MREKFIELPFTDHLEGTSFPGSDHMMCSFGLLLRRLVSIMVDGGKSEGSPGNLGSIVKRVGELGHVSFSCENDSDGRAARGPNYSL